jgi:hypothetical protein
MTHRAAQRAILGCVSLQPHSRAEHIMGMPATHTDWTVEMLDALPDDGQRYEVIDGNLYVTSHAGGASTIPARYLASALNGIRVG